MAEDEQKRILFISEATDGSSPAQSIMSELHDRLLRPAMPKDVYHRLDRGDIRAEPATLDHYTIDQLASEHLVVADLTELSNTAYFVLGARAFQRLPIVYICEESFPLRYDLRSPRVIKYKLEAMEEAIPDLREAIERALADPDAYTPEVGLPARLPRASRIELANRIQAAADTLRDLRINSAGETAEELVTIADELRKLPDDHEAARVRQLADKAIKVLSSLLDEMASRPAARMAITGAISLIVGGVGASGAAAFAAGLAFWYGKDTFEKYLEGWGKRSTGRKKK